MSYLKIGVDARPLSYGITGNSRYLFEILPFLVREDSPYRYTFFCNKPIHPVFADFFAQNSHLVQVIERKLVGFLWLHLAIPKLLNEHGMDIFWATLQMLPRRKLTIPAVVNYHDLNFISAPQTMARWNYYQHKWFSPGSLRNADRVFCLSQNTKNEILNLNANLSEKLQVVYPGVNIPQQENSKPTMVPEKYLFCLATLEPRKNLKTLVAAYLMLKKQNLEYPYALVIAGRRGWGESELSEKLLSGSYQSSGIYFIENPAEEQLEQLWQYCAAFLFPSTHEGFGLPILEALVRQKICIVSNIAVFQEIIQPKLDILVKPLDTEGWRAAMLQLAERKSLERKPKWQPSEWSWQKTAQQIESTFDEYRSMT